MPPSSSTYKIIFPSIFLTIYNLLPAFNFIERGQVAPGYLLLQTLGNLPLVRVRKKGIQSGKSPPQLTAKKQDPE
jgi:hypothetical protein